MQCDCFNALAVIDKLLLLKFVHTSLVSSAQTQTALLLEVVAWSQTHCKTFGGI